MRPDAVRSASPAARTSATESEFLQFAHGVPDGAIVGNQMAVGWAASRCGPRYCRRLQSFRAPPDDRTRATATAAPRVRASAPCTVSRMRSGGCSQMLEPPSESRRERPRARIRPWPSPSASSTHRLVALELDDPVVTAHRLPVLRHADAAELDGRPGFRDLASPTARCARQFPCRAA